MAAPEQNERITREINRAQVGENAERIKSALERIVEQGLPATTAERAQECTGKILRLIAEYQDAGVIAMGMAYGTLEELRA